MQEREEEVDVPVGSLADIKRKYESLLEIALLVQNLLDDVACQLERLQVRCVCRAVLGRGGGGGRGEEG